MQHIKHTSKYAHSMIALPQEDMLTYVSIILEKLGINK